MNERNEAHLHFVGTLLQIDEPILEVQIENWRNMIVIIIKMGQSLHIYLTSNDFRSAMNLEPIQKINTNTPSDHFAIFNKEEELYLVTYCTKIEAANELM